MLVTAVAVFVGIVAGGLLPPVGHRFARPKVRWPALLIAGVALLAIGTRVNGDIGLGTVLVGYGVLLVGVVANIHIVGMGVLLIGLATNMVVIALNGGMPVRAEALERAELKQPGEDISLSGHRFLEDGSTLLPFLDDRVPLPAGGQVVSFGDLVLAVGLADATAHITRRRRRDLLAENAADEDEIVRAVAGHPSMHAVVQDQEAILASLISAHLARTAAAAEAAKAEADPEAKVEAADRAPDDAVEAEEEIVLGAEFDVDVNIADEAGTAGRPPSLRHLAKSR